MFKSPRKALKTLSETQTYAENASYGKSGGHYLAQNNFTLSTTYLELSFPASHTIILDMYIFIKQLAPFTPENGPPLCPLEGFAGTFFSFAVEVWYNCGSPVVVTRPS